MTDSAVADLKDVTDRLQAAVGEITSPKEMLALGNEAAVIIRRRTRLGYGADGNNTQRFKLAPLTPSYVNFREFHSDYLSEMTTPKRSNLTFTGQMLDSLKPTTVQQGRVVIAPTGIRNDPFSEPGTTNQQVADWVSERGRPFLGLTTPEISQLVRFYRTRFGDLAREKRLID